MKDPIVVTITGAAGQIGYSLIPMVAKGLVFGPDQPIILKLLDIEAMKGVVDGVVMELNDCAYPLLHETVNTADPKVGFKDCDAAFLVGAMPRKAGMERKDLLAANVKIFKVQGEALDEVAKKSVKILKGGGKDILARIACPLGVNISQPGYVAPLPRAEVLEGVTDHTDNLAIVDIFFACAVGKSLTPLMACANRKCFDQTTQVLVVGNPANTNAFICSHYAKSIPNENFTALTRLDQNRGMHQIAAKCGVAVQGVKNVIIWGNHSATQYPDVSHATVNGKPAKDAVSDDAFLHGEFITTVQKRGAAVIAARKLSSALSAAKASVDHMRDWWCGTSEGEWVNMAVCSDGSYEIEKGLIYSFPVTVKGGNWSIVQGLSIDDFSRDKMNKTMAELQEEKAEAVKVCEAS